MLTGSRYQLDHDLAILRSQVTEPQALPAMGSGPVVAMCAAPVAVSSIDGGRQGNGRGGPCWQQLRDNRPGLMKADLYNDDRGAVASSGVQKDNGRGEQRDGAVGA